MSVLPVVVAMLLAAAPSPGDGRARLAAGQAAFVQGGFDKAVVHLEEAAALAAKANDEPLLVEIHLLRGQCFSALSDGARAEEAFLQVLGIDPEAKLDPASVRPSVVAVLDKLRAEAKAELKVRSDAAGARVILDGADAGEVPFKAIVPIGRHRLVVTSPAGVASDPQEVVVRARQSHDIWVRLGAPAPAAEVASAPSPLRSLLFADVRAAVEPAPPKGTGFAMAGELGAGIGGKHVAGSLHLGVGGRSFSAALRLTGLLPRLISIVGLHGSLDVPALVLDGGFVPGVGGALGADLAVASWMDLFVEAQYRHFFALPRADGTRYAADPVLVGLGARLRLP